MITIIYRRSDKLVVGKVTPPQDVDVEIKNIVNSELGGTSDDYGVAILTSEIPPGHKVVILDDGTATTEVDLVAAEANKEAKLNDPVIRALIEDIEEKLSLPRGELRRDVKDRIKE